MTYLPPPKGTFDVEWATQNNRIIQQEIGKLGPLASRVSELETGKQPSDADLTAIAALTGTGMLERTGADTWALRSTGAVGRSLLALAAPGAVRHIRVNADGSVDLRAAADYRGDLGLGTAATQNTGTSGANVPLLNGANTWSGTNGFQAVTATTLSTTSTATIGGNTSITGTLSTTAAAAIGSGLTVDGGAPYLFLREASGGADNEAYIVHFQKVLNVQNRTTAGAFVSTPFSLHIEAPDGAFRCYAASMVINEFGQDYDFRVEGDTDSNLLFCDASADRIGIGTSSPSEKLSVAGNISATGTISASNLAGTTYTPTGTGVANVSSVTTYVTPYQRVGNTVTIGGRYQIEATAAGNVRARLSLPVASNFANNFDAGGSGATTIGQNVAIYADAANDDLLFEFTAAAGGFFIFYFNATYRII